MATTPRQRNARPSQGGNQDTPPVGAQNSLSADAVRERPVGSRTTREPQALENSIRAIPSRERAAQGDRSSTPAASTATPLPKNPRAVPGYFSERYVQKQSRYYLPAGDLAIIDRGRVLETPTENDSVIRDMLQMHQERGETLLRVTGSESFRRKAWMAAVQFGMEVRGYRPSELEIQHSRKLISEHGQEPHSAARPPQIDAGAMQSPPEPSHVEGTDEELEINPHAPSRPTDSRVRVGRLLEHGEAHYQFDRRKQLSYYVRIETDRGEITQWGTDLDRAVKHSLSGAREGDDVVVRLLGEKPVTVTRPVRNEVGEIVREVEVKAKLNRWSVERADFIEERAKTATMVRDPSIDAATAVRRRPELAGTYAELHVAAVLAPKLYTHARDQERFVARLRDALADEIQRGEALTAPRPRDPIQKPGPGAPRTPDRAQQRILS